MPRSWETGAGLSGGKREKRETVTMHCSFRKPEGSGVPELKGSTYP